MNSIHTLRRLSPVVLPDTTWRALELAYENPPRAYHTLKHIVDVAHPFTRASWLRPRETFLAVLWHDAVYEVEQHDNEDRSAELFEKLGLPDASPPLSVNGP